ncbi:uncharacterized protein LOC110985555 [Acanthaster planci]|uniref:Uncharacterized protein LOC110985555 n=1 Tax=Acanthaster planci TaxID=133434 RepID=A0A8B7Z9J2_ACAPL|nr:uncharacterized protein LOC110985555 [Acanthaster planci]
MDQPVPNEAHLRSKESFTSHTVVNMSQRALSADETKVLSRGMNFALVPQSSPTEDIIQHTEPILRHLDKSAYDEIRLQVHQALRKHKPAKPNISKQEQAAINSMRQDKTIHILRADKGNATVIMDKTEYDSLNKSLDRATDNCRSDMRRIDFRTPYTKSNISKAERQALRSLKDADFVIKRIDKAGATVLWHKDLCPDLLESERQLSDHRLPKAALYRTPISFSEKMMPNFTVPAPLLYKRYIDDIIGATREDVQKFIDYADSLHPALHLTSEISNETVTFLGIKLSINGNSLTTSVHNKSTDSHS